LVRIASWNVQTTYQTMHFHIRSILAIVDINIGNNVRIEHNCHLMSCIIDDNVHIGFKSVIQ
jgi:carbonic anhydrase/acetyltransferase-like protein (isoleucine patch superfamily)